MILLSFKGFIFLLKVFYFYEASFFSPQKNKKMSNTDHTKKPEVNTGAEEG
jgi:hypothetical protein